MKIHEYQAKKLFARHSIPVQQQKVAVTVEEAVAAADAIGYPAVIKAQVLTGGRGKAGGVKLVESSEQARAAAQKILGLSIKEWKVEKVLVVPAIDIAEEFYVGITLNRSDRRMVLMMSKEGGMDIEQLAVSNPDAIVRCNIEADGILDDKVLSAAIDRLGLDSKIRAPYADIVARLAVMAQHYDCSTIEINPLVRAADGTLCALDAKIEFDENGMMRHKDLQPLRNLEEHSREEIEARENGLAFIPMDGDIGCIVNGAGLAMATMDLINLFGGEAANFLDVGGSSNPAKVLCAFQIITRNPRVRAILINIFGGITRCDDIANGILMAMKQIVIDVPIVIRLIGTNEEEGQRILKNHNIEVMEDLSTAVKQVITVAKDGDLRK